MCITPEHIKWLVDTEERITTIEGKIVEVWELRHQPDDAILSAWAKYFRNHYCSDEDIDDLRSAIGCSRSEYLVNHKFPEKNTRLGPGIRAGDFGEILVADFLQYLQHYWVPRTRYDRKTVHDESTKGSDIIGFKILKSGESTPEDTLAIFEAKTQFSGKKAISRLQDAVKGSKTDQVRKGDSLNAIKQRFLRVDPDAKMRVERFQNKLDNPYIEISGAAALFSLPLYDPEIIRTTVTIEHPNNKNLILLVIRGEEMMKLVHELYRRAADEA